MGCLSVPPCSQTQCSNRAIARPAQPAGPQSGPGHAFLNPQRSANPHSRPRVPRLQAAAPPEGPLHTKISCSRPSTQGVRRRSPECRDAQTPPRGACPSTTAEVGESPARKNSAKLRPFNPAASFCTASTSGGRVRDLLPIRYGFPPTGLMTNHRARYILPLFGSSALRPFGSSVFAVAVPLGPFRAFLLEPKRSSRWFNFPFFFQSLPGPASSGSPRVPEAWVALILLGKAKLPRECFTESSVEWGV